MQAGAGVFNTGSSGVGLAVALSLIDTDTQAWVGGRVTSTGDVSVTADTDTVNHIVEADSRNLGNTGDLFTQVSNQYNQFARDTAQPFTSQGAVGPLNPLESFVNKMFPVVKSGKLNGCERKCWVERFWRSGGHAQGLSPTLFPIGFPQLVMSHDAQVQHGWSHVLPPPGSGALQASLDKVSVGALDRTRADGQVSSECARVVQLVDAVGEVAPRAAHRRLLVLHGSGFEVGLQRRNHLGSPSRRQSRLLGLQPILGGIRRADLAGGSQIVANVEQVDQKGSLRAELLLDLVRYPRRTVADTVNLRLGVELQCRSQLFQEGPASAGPSIVTPTFGTTSPCR